MSNFIQHGKDGRLYYRSSDGKWYPYTESSYSDTTPASTQQYHQGQYAERRPSYHQYADNTAEAGSFYGEYDEDDVPAASSSTQGGSTETAKYVKKQEKERRHREKLREGGRSGRSKHKSNTKKKIDETLKPFYNSK
ncbi:hypothetical protein CABS01_11881 [Colletotrichum abscissum]|uniref:Uncharacterized protein n=1 Tax=Colletotrichum abscissum TaxID=1671311 RepID=A0A9P9XDN3_9PEZI|nr:uncharacterized protein CABS01_11881 [Colletotrichum abscissum]KAI3548907.1 hypothetical protein CABS02_08110 [Colletotrichum abscissum]KAK1492364.1 hypothetical protein CABS01_11881 [Colletotrichum abscissum]KAK1712680.1 hypothetical protein BDP67DRAFT_578351 [Colletotrichum lupini]